MRFDDLIYYWKGYYLQLCIMSKRLMNSKVNKILSNIYPNVYAFPIKNFVLKIFTSDKLLVLTHECVLPVTSSLINLANVLSPTHYLTLESKVLI